MARFLGVDVGTTLCTAVVVDDHGTVLASRSGAIPTQRPASGRVEQDPQDLLAAFDAAVDPLVASHKPDAVGVANQGESFVLWDRFTGLPLTPNIVWEAPASPHPKSLRWGVPPGGWPPGCQTAPATRGPSAGHGC